MDDAVLGSIDIALKKARTSVLFQSSSEAVLRRPPPDFLPFHVIVNWPALIR